MSTPKGGSAWCAANNCKNSRKKGWRMFRFPKDAERCKKWTQNTRREDLLQRTPEYINKNCYLCSDHFEDSQFMNSSKQCLIWCAVPTLFNNIPNTPPKVTKKRRLPSRQGEDQPKKKSRKSAATSLKSETETVPDSLTETVPDSSTSGLPILSACDEVPTSMSAISSHDSCQDTPKSQLPSSLPCQEPSVLASVDSTAEQGHNATMESDLFQSSFLHSPAFLLWRQVGEQHGLHTNENIACFLLKFYQDTSKLFLSDLTRCRTCGNPVAVTCTHCDWMIHVQKTFGNLPKQSSCSNASLQSSLTPDIDVADTDVKKERDDSGEWKITHSSDDVEENDSNEDENIDDCSPFLSAFPLPKEETVTVSEMQERCMESREMLEATDSSQTVQCDQTTRRSGVDSEDTAEATDTSQPVYCDQATQDSDLPEDTAEHRPVAIQATQHNLPLSHESSNTGSDQVVVKKRFECNICRKTYSMAKTLRKHKVIHSGKKPFACDVCPKTFLLKDSWRGHKKIHKRPFPCDKCSKSFKEEDSLAAHKICHEEKHISKSVSCNQKKTQERTLFSCELCEINFRSKNMFVRHKKRHENNLPHIRCSWCDNRFFIKKDWEAHILTHKDKKCYECNLCDKSFRGPHSLRCHMRKHTGQEPYMCEYCGKRFADGRNLRLHVRIHTGERPYVCEVCKADFMHESTLQYHRLIHTDSVYTCEICQKTFSQERYLKSHKLIHSQTDLKVHKCDLCSRAFRWPSVLKKHKMAHNGTLGDNTTSSSEVQHYPRKHWCNNYSTKNVQRNQKKYMCDLCGRLCYSPGELHLHKKFRHFGESPFQCDVCNKKCSSFQSLNGHKRIHTGEKPFVCSTCGKAFSSDSNCRKHRVHTGEKPFKCTLCSNSYAQPDGLKVHMLVHADIKPFECDVCFKSFREKGTMKKHRQIHYRDNSGQS